MFIFFLDCLNLSVWKRALRAVGFTGGFGQIQQYLASQTCSDLDNVMIHRSVPSTVEVVVSSRLEFAREFKSSSYHGS